MKIEEFKKADELFHKVEQFKHWGMWHKMRGAGQSDQGSAFDALCEKHAAEIQEFYDSGLKNAEAEFASFHTERDEVVKAESYFEELMRGLEGLASRLNGSAPVGADGKQPDAEAAGKITWVDAAPDSSGDCVDCRAFDENGEYFCRVQFEKGSNTFSANWVNGPEFNARYIDLDAAKRRVVKIKLQLQG